jgi:hypothetical protein
MVGGDAAYGGDEHEDEDEDVEELFEDDSAEDGGGRGTEVVGVGEDAHDVADAEGEDVVGGERGHEDASADEEMLLDGARPERHHLAPANAAKGVAGEGEAEDAEDPRGMNEAQCEDLIEGDSAEGVPEEEGADEHAGDGLQQIASAGGLSRRAHAGTWPGRLSRGRWRVAQRRGWLEGRCNMQLRLYLLVLRLRLLERRTTLE